MSKVIVQVKLNLNKMLTIWIRALNMITTTSMCAIVLRIAFAQDALGNRKLLIDCSWNWKGSKPKMLFFEDKQQREGMLWISFWKLMQRSGHIQVCRTKNLSICYSEIKKAALLVWFKKGYFNQGSQKFQDITKKDRATDETVSERRINFSVT